MVPVKAVSFTPNVIEWLENPDGPRILHVFDQACNLINARGEVLSIVTSRIGDGPFNLVVENAPLLSEYLNITSPVSVSHNQLTFSELVINTADAKLWNSHPDWNEFHTQRDKILNQLTALPIENHQPSLPVHLLSACTKSIVAGDLPSSLDIARQLAGLGFGLTPAGDDFIMGAMYAVWIIHPLETAKVFAEQITSQAAPLTTSLSSAWLRSAGKGEAGILWHGFFDALIWSDRTGIQAAARNIFAIGETSGADALAGFVGTFMASAELMNSRSR